MTPVTYRLIRSARRTVSLEITRDCDILVRAPLQMRHEDIDDFVTRHTHWIALHLAQAKNRAESHPEPTEDARDTYIARAKILLPEKVAYYGGLMGLNPTGITVTGAKTRFGSCSAKNRLCFSWRLLQYPNAAIDYVVVHELAHILHKNHGRDFYTCVEKILPDYRERQALLKK